MSADQEQPNLTMQTAAGLRWSYLDSVINAVGQLVYVALMSRLLTPVAFGLMAIANTSMVLGMFVAQMGIAHALIQRPRVTEDDIRAGATSGLVLGALSGTAFALLAPHIAGLFGEPAATPLLRVMGVNFLMSGLQMTSQGLLRRALRFRAQAVIGIVTTVMSYAVGIVLGIAGAGVWSLVAAILVHSVLRTVLSYVAVRHTWRPLLRWEPYRRLFGFGSRSTALRLLEVLSINIDTLAVGRYASTFALGLYNRAYYLVMLPIGEYLTMTLLRVLFPGFSRIQQDTSRLREVFRNTLLLVCILLFPICAGIAVARRELIVVVLGHQWLDAVVFVPWFALAGAMGFVARIVVMLCESRAQLNVAVIVETSFVILLGGLLVAVSGREPWAFAAAVAAAEVVRTFAYIPVARRVVGMSRADLRYACVPPLLACVWTAVVVAGARWALVALSSPALLVLFGEMVLGAVALFMFIRLSPFDHVRRQLWLRCVVSGLVSRDNSRGWRLVSFLLGPARAIEVVA